MPEGKPGVRRGSEYEPVRPHGVIRSESRPGGQEPEFMNDRAGYLDNVILA